MQGESFKELNKEALSIIEIPCSENKFVLKYFKLDESKSKYHQDIIPGEYEGGMKLWDCEVDLLQFLEKESGKKVVIEGKTVM